VGNAPGTEYFRWLYDSNIWKDMHYRGVRVLKMPSDMWNYQEIFTDYRVDWVLETGSLHGGSALYFADMLKATGARGKVISIDRDGSNNNVGRHPRIEFWIGDSASQSMAERVRARLPAHRGALFAILDSDHSMRHVLMEMEAYVPLLREGDYLVVEDGCVNGHPVRPDYGPGPYEAVEEFMARQPGVLSYDRAREHRFGMTAAPNGYLIKT
jgi:cephalosporin hydroxylase